MERTSVFTVSRDIEGIQRGDASATPTLGRPAGKIVGGILDGKCIPKGARPAPTPLDAMRAFRRLAAPLRLRVRRDAEGWPVIPGKRGTIEWFDGRVMAVHTIHPRLFSRLWALPGIRRWQVGDHEVRALFPLTTLPLVAMLVRARRRRHPSTAAHLRRGADAPYSATSAA
jgi:hypothetical protein